MTDWNAVGAVSTAGAALVALGLGVTGERRARAEGRRADRRLEIQVAQVEYRRQQEFIAERLLDLVDAVALWTSNANGPQAAEATTRMRALVEVLPDNYATTIRRWLGRDLDPRHANIWRRYAPDDHPDGWTQPDPAWVQAELADDIRDALQMYRG